ncbi:iron complex transport system ATP-binding protein [Anoxybacillus vitaminiphilus]|uniref:Iron complex transport system ATP-binding protein n=2 Tax=Paranoxybacillus vitaminiphilus TaxID=581036 RepID=A0A327YR84_9BACL|nr:iron complex transport system ATP-binding protein [Anoxybacillus vitaminiphilus]
MLRLENVSYSYGSEVVLKDLTFSVHKGELFGILGPNGSGKTTLLKLLSRELSPQAGTISLNGKALSFYNQKEFARLVAVLPQTVEMSFGYTVKETAELGRYAYQSSLFPKWTEEDEKAVTEALRQVDLWEKRDKYVDSLSGGERQRTYLARALVQEPEVLLLDEPTNHMDIAHQMNLLNALKRWTKEKKLTVIAIFHDINLASLYCDRILLLHNGEMIGVNKPRHLVDERILQKVFQTSVKRQEHPVVPKPLITFLPNIEAFGEHCGDIRDKVTVTANDEMIAIKTMHPFKVFSSALVGAGFQWATRFVNRHVPKDYRCDDACEEMKQYLRMHDFDIHRTIGMMTAVRLEDAAYVHMKTECFSLFTVVTAGVGNAVDISKAWEREMLTQGPGTINMMIFIDGHLTDAAYAQAMMTATEAKVKALFDEQIIDPETATPATGTSTDSIAIAATQKGHYFEYAGTITPIGKAIGRSVYEATRQALQKYRERRREYQ